MRNNSRRHRQLIETVDEGREINTIYGDLITFIMALFILLFVLSYNQKKDDTFFTQMRLKFGAPNIEQSNEITSEALLVSDIRGFIKEEELEQETQILVDEKKIKIILQPPVLFQSGRSELTKKGKELLSGFGNILKDVENPIIVEGHTDNIPINNKRYDSNWDLSFHRAYSVVKHFISEYRFSPRQLSGMGYGEYQPLFPNDTAANRAKNRRIEVNIIRLTPAEADRQAPPTT